MFDSFFASPTVILLGALTGLVFGFLLQKGAVARYDVIVSQFLLRDFTVLKTMLTAIVVGGIGVYAMLELGLIERLHVKAATLATNGLGGLIFGVGMVLLGYCPGTGLAAIGQGSKDAIAGVLGMLAGALLYAEAYPFVKAHVEPLFALDGKAADHTLPALTGVSPWVFLAVLALGAIALFRGLEKRGK
jgi:uncharacterized membrane protein YedE/YeeE